MASDKGGDGKPVYSSGGGGFRNTKKVSLSGGFSSDSSGGWSSEGGNFSTPKTTKTSSSSGFSSGSSGGWSGGSDSGSGGGGFRDGSGSSGGGFSGGSSGGGGFKDETPAAPKPIVPSSGGGGGGGGGSTYISRGPRYTETIKLAEGGKHTETVEVLESIGGSYEVRSSPQQKAGPLKTPIDTPYPHEFEGFLAQAGPSPDHPAYISSQRYMIEGSNLPAYVVDINVPGEGRELMRERLGGYEPEGYGFYEFQADTDPEMERLYFPKDLFSEGLISGVSLKGGKIPTGKGGTQDVFSLSIDVELPSTEEITRAVSVISPSVKTKKGETPSGFPYHMQGPDVEHPFGPFKEAWYPGVSLGPGEAPVIRISSKYYEGDVAFTKGEIENLKGIPGIGTLFGATVGAHEIGAKEYLENLISPDIRVTGKTSKITMRTPADTISADIKEADVNYFAYGLKKWDEYFEKGTQMREAEHYEGRGVSGLIEAGTDFGFAIVTNVAKGIKEYGNEMAVSMRESTKGAPEYAKNLAGAWFYSEGLNKDIYPQILPGETAYTVKGIAYHGTKMVLDFPPLLVETVFRTPQYAGKAAGRVALPFVFADKGDEVIKTYGGWAVLAGIGIGEFGLSAVKKPEVLGYGAVEVASVFMAGKVIGAGVSKLRGKPEPKYTYKAMTEKELSEANRWFEAHKKGLETDIFAKERAARSSYINTVMDTGRMGRGDFFGDLRYNIESFYYTTKFKITSGMKEAPKAGDVVSTKQDLFARTDIRVGTVDVGGGVAQKFLFAEKVFTPEVGIASGISTFSIFAQEGRKTTKPTDIITSKTPTFDFTSSISGQKSMGKMTVSKQRRIEALEMEKIDAGIDYALRHPTKQEMLEEYKMGLKYGPAQLYRMSQREGARQRQRERVGLLTGVATRTGQRMGERIGIAENVRLKLQLKMRTREPPLIIPPLAIQPIGYSEGGRRKRSIRAPLEVGAPPDLTSAILGIKGKKVGGTALATGIGIRPFTKGWMKKTRRLF